MNNFQTDLFDPEMGPKQVLPLQVRVNIGVMTIEEYFTLPIASRTGASTSVAI